METLKVLSRVIPGDIIDHDIGEVLSFSFASEATMVKNGITDRRHVLAVVCKVSNNNSNVCCLVQAQ